MRNDTMKFTNPTAHTINLDAIGLDPVKPGETAEIPLHLAAAGRNDNGGRQKSPLECVAPQLIPADKEDHAVWMAVPAPATPVSRVVSISAPSVQKEPPGVKALREAQAKKVAETAQKPAVGVSK